MSDHRLALESILRECNASRNYTRRTQKIHEIAMVALGLTQGQRTERHNRILERAQTMQAAWETGGAGKAHALQKVFNLEVRQENLE